VLGRAALTLCLWFLESSAAALGCPNLEAGLQVACPVTSELIIHG